MLTIYRRHKKACGHRKDGRKYRGCDCPIWAQGTLSGERIRESLDLCSWTKANELVHKWEAAGTRHAQEAEAITVEQAREQFLADARARKLAEQTIYKYTLLFRQLKGFAERRGLRFLAELNVETLSAFRQEWKDGPRASAKKLERLRAFLRFCERRKWIAENPAADLKPPKVTVRPTLPFGKDEMIRILAATGEYGRIAAHNAKGNAVRLRSFVLLMRYSGMRISDCVGLSQDRIQGNRLLLYTAKTGVPVYCVLPDFVVSALASMPRTTERYPFWTGAGSLVTAVKVWETRMRRLFKLAKIPGGHSHQFRDTFAVELLLAGVPMERVSILLGHQSIRITERHYAPWVRSRQEQLEADLERTWAADPVALLESDSTPQVHGETSHPN
jgi:integrase/recombinase XerD